MPANIAEIENAMSLYFVMLIPMDSAAMRLSLIAMMALPALDCTKFRITINVISTSTNPTM